MFAKYWEPGAVKTRLAAHVGEQAAASLHQHFVATLISRLAGHGDTRQLCYWPPAAENAFKQAAGSNWSLAVQSAGDLGARMEGFFQAAFNNGASRVVLVGSDSPSLPVSYIEQAFELLKDHPVVLGPAEDGGYYLIGASLATPPVFNDIAWSSGDVWRQTTARLEAAGIAYASLPAWYDVDLWPDLQRLLNDLQRNDISPALLQKVQEVVSAQPQSGDQP